MDLDSGCETIHSKYEERAIIALELIWSMKWTPADILATCNALEDIWVCVDDPTLNALSMKSFKEHGLSDDRWDFLWKVVAKSYHLAFAVDVVAMEYWSGNESFIDLIKEGDPCLK